MDADSIEEIERLVVQGLFTEGGHHKQWYLEQILIALGVDLEALAGRMRRETGYTWEPGIPD